MPNEENWVDWRIGDHVEQLISYILSGAMLDGELENRLMRAEQQGIPSAAARRAAYNALVTTPPGDAEDRKRVLLQSLVADLQERRRRDSQIRGMRLTAVRFVTNLAVFLLIIVALPLILYVLHLFASGIFSPTGDTGVAAAAAEPSVTWVSKFVESFPNFGLFTTVSFGALGALFSRFMVLQKAQLDMSLDEAGTYYSKRYVILRIMVGTVGAIIIYFFVGSGLIEGTLVPNIRELTYVPAMVGEDGIKTFLGTPSDSAMVPAVNMCLLIVWAFVAGFSEQLVPSLLDETARRVQTRSNEAANPPAPAPLPVPPVGDANRANGAPQPQNAGGNGEGPARGEPPKR